MSTVDELFETMSESSGGVTDVCVIDPSTRIIDVPSMYKELGVVSDEKVNRLFFACSKIVGDNVDLTNYNLYVNYQNAAGELNAYLIDDVDIMQETQGHMITFSWLLSRHVTKAPGTVHYIICAKKSDGINTTNEWNTKVATGIVIANDIEPVKEIEEQNADVIEQILSRIDVLENGSRSSVSLGIKGAQSGMSAQIKSVDSNGQPTAWEPFDTYDDIRSFLDKEGLPGYAKKTEIPTKVSELENDSGYLTEHQSLVDYAKKTDIEALSDIQYLTANLFNPTNITHGSKYNYTTGVAESSDVACRTTNLIELDNSKEYNILYYRYETPNASQIYVFAYDEDGNVIKHYDEDSGKTLAYLSGLEHQSSSGKVRLVHITGASSIGFFVYNFTAKYPDRAPQVMVWETTDANDYNAEYIAYGSVGGKYKLPRLVIDQKETTTTVKNKPQFYNKFLNISYSSFESLAPANTLETYLTAAKLGFDAIKGDVRITSDDKLIMCHDAGFTFNDAGYIKGYVQANSTPIREMTLEECRSHLYSNSSIMSANLGHNCKVATFEDYIKICREYNKVAYITVRDEYMDTIAPMVIDCLNKYNMMYNAIINSFTVESLQKFRALDENIMLSNVLNSQVALTTTHIDTAISLGNCMTAIFAFPFDTSWTVMDNSVAALTYAKEKGVLVYGAQIKSYEDYAKCIEYGLSGLQIASLILPYEPKRYCMKITVTDGVATFSDEFTASRYTATVTQSNNTISVSDIKLSGSARGFDDGVMQLWLNKLPYTLTIREESNKTCSASYSNGAINITTDGDTAAVYHLTVTV